MYEKDWRTTMSTEPTTPMKPIRDGIATLFICLKEIRIAIMHAAIE